MKTTLACTAGEILPKPAALQGQPAMDADEPCRLLTGPSVPR